MLLITDVLFWLNGAAICLDLNKLIFNFLGKFGSIWDFMGFFGKYDTKCIWSSAIYATMRFFKEISLKYEFMEKNIRHLSKLIYKEEFLGKTLAKHRNVHMVLEELGLSFDDKITLRNQFRKMS